MIMTYNTVPISPLSKETLKKYKNDMGVQVRMNIMKDYVQKIYGETIRSAMYGDTNYTFALYNQPYLQDKKYILPVVVITISIVIYYIFKLLQFYFT